ncbi:glycosyltransferase family 4 protein [Fulvivirga sedimenti]|uniref:Glycosyltransferase family 4 protein n=1 Tax=Fulvivirga sedimenti TaxID=2879465 RepID=A0A9X1KXG9_9BACT|nr:glycosyltransferase family 4 protein [Fulvivirga sedimenti]MCA6074728.1 glycosyltransferase family 4 protein [Fulvivirga sedimenti]MCA6075905.1 glycosyltransferase family 4 protein [Fulvivirga sedimenti]MCA6077033.1 glycosyltransferase family 4 protein [Fulvivirga sedimenti]
MNILLLTYQGGIAGSTLSITYLARGLAERGHAVYVGCPADALLAGYFEDSPVTVIPMVFRGKLDFRNARNLKSITDTYDIDIVNAQSSLDRYTSLIAKKIFGMKSKLVFTRRQVSKSIGGPQSWLYQWGADRFVAVSDGIRDSLISDGIKAKNISVVYNGTPASKYDTVDTNAAENIRRRLNINPDDFVIGCVSRLKNQLQILQALAQIDDPVTMIFVGVEEIPGFDIQKLKEKGHRIFFEGRLPAKDILPYYLIFDIMILASTMEGLSQSLLESMFMKVPVIATAAAGNLDLVKDGRNGLLFNDRDIDALVEKIVLLRENPELQEKLAEGGYKTARLDFSIENTLDGYERLFSSLLDE